MLYVSLILNEWRIDSYLSIAGPLFAISDLLPSAETCSMRRRSSCSWPRLTSGLCQEQIWWTNDQVSFCNNTSARSNVKWGHNETKSLLEVLENRLKEKGMIWVSPGNEKIADQVNHKCNTAFNDKHIEAQMKLLRYVYKYRWKDSSSVRSLQASLSDADWYKFLYVFRYINSKRGTTGAATNSQATNEAETGASITATGAGSAATNSCAGPSRGPSTPAFMKLFKEAHEKLQRALLPSDLLTFAVAGLLNEYFLVTLLSIPDESIFKFVNDRMEAFCDKGEDFT